MVFQAPFVQPPAAGRHKRLEHMQLLVMLCRIGLSGVPSTSPTHTYIWLKLGNLGRQPACPSVLTTLVAGVSEARGGLYHHLRLHYHLGAHAHLKLQQGAGGSSNRSIRWRLVEVQGHREVTAVMVCRGSAGLSHPIQRHATRSLCRSTELWASTVAFPSTDLQR